jgi:hypothetical protein
MRCDAPCREHGGPTSTVQQRYRVARAGKTSRASVPPRFWWPAVFPTRQDPDSAAPGAETGAAARWSPTAWHGNGPGSMETPSLRPGKTIGRAASRAVEEAGHNFRLSQHPPRRFTCRAGCMPRERFKLRLYEAVYGRRAVENPLRFLVPTPERHGRALLAAMSPRSSSVIRG